MRLRKRPFLTTISTTSSGSTRSAPGGPIRRASSHGAQFRSGGRVAYWVFDANGLDSFVSPPGGGFYKCVCQNYHDISAQLSRGEGLAIGGMDSDSDFARTHEFQPVVASGGEIDSCIVVNKLPGVNHYAIETGAGNQGRYAAIRNSIVINSGVAISLEGSLSPNPGKLDIRNNLFDCGSSPTFATYTPRERRGTGTRPITMSLSVIHRAASAPGRNRCWGPILGVPYQIRGEFEDRYAALSRLMANLGTYGQTLKAGIKTEDDFRNYLRNRPLGKWDASYEMQSIYRYFKTQYAP